MVLDDGGGGGGRRGLVGGGGGRRVERLLCSGGSVDSAVLCGVMHGVGEEEGSVHVLVGRTLW